MSGWIWGHHGALLLLLRRLEVERVVFGEGAQEASVPRMSVDPQG